MAGSGGFGSEERRLFVGNLFPEVTKDDFAKLFARFGTVTSAEVKSKKDMDGQVRIKRLYYSSSSHLLSLRLFVRIHRWLALSPS